MSTERRTLFQERADAYQRKQDRTKEAGIRSGLEVVGASVAGLILFGILDYVAREMSGFVLFIVPIGMVCSAIGIVAGLVMTIVGFVRPTKLVTCPRCGTEHRIYTNVLKYMCTNCRALLLLGKDVGMVPQLSACPYCGLHTAATDDHGRFLCPNCGIVRESVATEGWAETRTCPECNQTIAEGAIYCRFCGCILKDDFSQPPQQDLALAYDQDWRIGKDAVGHVYFAQALMKGIRERLRTEVDIADVQLLITKLEDALVSAEEALQESEHRSSVEAILPEADVTYAALLESELSSVRALDPKKVLAKDALDIVATEPHIAARRRIEDILGASLESSGSIGEWSEKLVGVEKAEKHSRVKNYEKLENEVARFAGWREQQTQLDSLH